tara:strand:- start:2795 stop:3643 length:849 start_codon:yes stop_codon:yes gene_type:complete
MNTKSRLLANAKINITLDVYNKRENGYHDIRSLVAFIDLYDEIFLTSANVFSVEFRGEFSDSISTTDNLLSITHEFMYSRYPNIKSYSALVKKNIPVSSGLGGGTADAAALLRYIMDDNKINYSEINNEEFTYKIGSDMLVCIHNCSSFVSGVGDIVKKVSLDQNYHGVLINPNIIVSTKNIYEEYISEITPNDHCYTESVTREYIMNGKNDLQPIVSKHYPIINSIIGSIEDTENCIVARMSGSGPTCFGLYEDELTSKKALEALRKLYPSYWVKKFIIID